MPKKPSAKKTTVSKKTTSKKSSSKKSSAKKTSAVVDLHKQFPEFYEASTTEVQIVDVPAMNFFMIDGKGDPNDNPIFQAGVQALYSASYTLKIGGKKKGEITQDYKVPPLEGLWYMENMAEWSMDHKDKWQFTLMIRIPDFITVEQAQTAISEAKAKKKAAESLEKLRIESYTEGKCVQLMHLGPYDTEGPNILKIHQFAKDQGYILDGKHHEIYYGDPRKGNPEKLKTILRQPIKLA